MAMLALARCVITRMDGLVALLFKFRMLRHDARRLAHGPALPTSKNPEGRSTHRQRQHDTDPDSQPEPVVVTECREAGVALAVTYQPHLVAEQSGSDGQAEPVGPAQRG